MDNIKEKLFSNKEDLIYEALNEIQTKKMGQYVEDILEVFTESSISIFLKEKIIEVLEELLDQNTVYSVLPLLVNPDPYIRNAAMKLLRENQNLIFDYLKELIKDQDRNIRKYTLDALFNYRFKESAKVIREALNDSDINNVIAACEYLGKLKDYESKELLENLFEKSDNPMLIHTIIEALAEIGDESSVQKVYKKIKSDSSDIIKYSFLKLVKNKSCTPSDLDIISDFFDGDKKFLLRYLFDATVEVLKRCRKKGEHVNNDRIYNFIISVYDRLDDNILKTIALEIMILMKPDSDETKNIFKKALKSDDELLYFQALEKINYFKSVDDEIISLIKEIKNRTKDKDLEILIDEILKNY